MLLILDFNEIEDLKSLGLIIHAIRNVITNTDNIIDNENIPQWLGLLLERRSFAEGASGQ